MRWLKNHRSGRWRNWYAWRPVCTRHQGWVWLEKVQRRYWRGYSGHWWAEYKLYEDV